MRIKEQNINLKPSQRALHISKLIEDWLAVEDLSDLMPACMPQGIIQGRHQLGTELSGRSLEDIDFILAASSLRSLSLYIYALLWIIATAQSVSFLN